MMAPSQYGMHHYDSPSSYSADYPPASRSGYGEHRPSTSGPYDSSYTSSPALSHEQRRHDSHSVLPPYQSQQSSFSRSPYQQPLSMSSMRATSVPSASATPNYPYPAPHSQVSSQTLGSSAPGYPPYVLTIIPRPYLTDMSGHKCTLPQIMVAVIIIRYQRCIRQHQPHLPHTHRMTPHKSSLHRKQATCLGYRLPLADHKTVLSCHAFSTLDRNLSAGSTGATDDNFPHSAIFYDISEKSRGQLRKATVLDVERNLHVPLREMGTWRTINASLEDHLMRATEQRLLQENCCKENFKTRKRPTWKPREMLNTRHNIDVGQEVGYREHF
jgi:hypothetical protein